MRNRSSEKWADSFLHPPLFSICAAPPVLSVSHWFQWRGCHDGSSVFRGEELNLRELCRSKHSLTLTHPHTHMHAFEHMHIIPSGVMWACTCVCFSISNGVRLVFLSINNILWRPTAPGGSQSLEPHQKKCCFWVRGVCNVTGKEGWKMSASNWSWQSLSPGSLNAFHTHRKYL